MEVNKILFRASSMGEVMTGVAKNLNVENSLTCKRKLIQIYREINWKRKSNRGNKYIDKGNEVEQDSITLYSRVKKSMFKKNDIRLVNGYFTGELDIYEGDSITSAIHTIDIKSSWDWITFPSMCDTVDASYDYQGQVYMDLTGAKKHTIAYCLVNTPANIILDEKKKLAYKMGVIDLETPEYIEACIEIEKNHIYDMELFLSHNPWFHLHCKNWDFDIQMSQRIHEIVVERDDDKIQKMYARIDDCRKWISDNFLK